MKDEKRKGKIAFYLDGKAIAGFCKKCGEFTLNIKVMLCAMCMMEDALFKINKVSIATIEKEK